MTTTLPTTLYGAAVDLWHLVGLTRPWNDPLVEGPSSTVLAHVRDGALVGTAMVGLDGAVDPVAQGRGHGRALVQVCEQWARDRAAPKLMLMVRSGNSDVLGFYASLGYEVNEVATLGKVLSPR